MTPSAKEKKGAKPKAKSSKGRKSAATKRAKERTDGLIDHRLTRALAHPLRVSILAVANQRILTPKGFADEFDAPLANVSYHVRQLVKYDCLELVKTAPVRGSTQHYYRGSRRGLITDSNWRALGKNVQTGLRVAGMQDLLGRCEQALNAETFDSREDAIFYWIGGVVDEIGWKKFTQVVNRAIEEVTEIEVESVQRMAESGEDCIPMTFATMGFESPKQKKRKTPQKSRNKQPQVKK